MSDKQIISTQDIEKFKKKWYNSVVHTIHYLVVGGMILSEEVLDSLDKEEIRELFDLLAAPENSGDRKTILGFYFSNTREKVNDAKNVSVYKFFLNCIKDNQELCIHLQKLSLRARFPEDYTQPDLFSGEGAGIYTAGKVSRDEGEE